MKITQLKLGPMDNFSYILKAPDGSSCAIIDPAWEPETIDKVLQKEHLTLQLLLLTHAHPDHINAAAYFLRKYPGIALNMRSEDSFMLEEKLEPLSFLKDGAELTLGPGTIKVIHTPGHSPGSVCYLSSGAVFTGDTLFLGACGRVDLPGSDPKALRRSLLKLAALPDETLLYPGHSYNGDSSTIGAQKRDNPYLKLAAGTDADFIKEAL